MEFPEKIFCVKCGQELPGDAAFCSACGAVAHKPKTAPVAETVPLMECSPYEQTAPLAQPPVFERTVSLVEEAPVKPYRFPVAPLIFVGMALMYYFIIFIGYVANNYSANSLFTSFLECTGYTLAVLGLILCRNKRNLLFGFGFMAVALTYGIYFIRNISYNSQAIYIIVNSLKFLSFAMIGTSYLVAKPGIRALKIVFCIMLLLFGFIGYIYTVSNVLNHLRWYETGYVIRSIMAFPLGVLCPALAAFTYTPFKED